MQHLNLFLKFVKIKMVRLPTIEDNLAGLNGCQDPIKVQFQILGFRCHILTIKSPLQNQITVLHLLANTPLQYRHLFPRAPQMSRFLEGQYEEREGDHQRRPNNLSSKKVHFQNN